jgi:hypothetical protein
VRAGADPTADPFGERRRPARRLRVCVLGGEFDFVSDSPELLRIAARAYAGLPAQRLARTGARFEVRLMLGQERRPAARAAPPVQALAAGELLIGAVARSSFMAVDARRRLALVLVSPELLRFPHLVRYELIEFAVYCLAARAQRLVPLHAACVGAAGGAALLLGASGAGKSTLVLHALQAGLTFLAEDSVLVEPRGLLATGVPSFLHLRLDGPRFLTGTVLATALRKAPRIVRRSGVRKYELDTRGGPFALARAPLHLRALIFLSARRAPDPDLLRRLAPAAVPGRLEKDQPYAAGQPGWRGFMRAAARLPAFELRRGAHPRAAVAALAALLAKAPAARSR